MRGESLMLNLQLCLLLIISSAYSKPLESTKLASYTLLTSQVNKIKELTDSREGVPAFNNDVRFCAFNGSWKEVSSSLYIDQSPSFDENCKIKEYVNALLMFSIGAIVMSAITVVLLLVLTALMIFKRKTAKVSSFPVRLLMFVIPLALFVGASVFYSVSMDNVRSSQIDYIRSISGDFESIYKSLQLLTLEITENGPNIPEHSGIDEETYKKILEIKDNIDRVIRPDFEAYINEPYVVIDSALHLPQILVYVAPIFLCVIGLLIMVFNICKPCQCVAVFLIALFFILFWLGLVICLSEAKLASDICQEFEYASTPDRMKESFFYSFFNCSMVSMDPESAKDISHTLVSTRCMVLSRGCTYNNGPVMCSPDFQSSCANNYGIYPDFMIKDTQFSVKSCNESCAYHSQAATLIESVQIMSNFELNMKKLNYLDGCGLFSKFITTARPYFCSKLKKLYINLFLANSISSVAVLLSIVFIYHVFTSIT